jgi:CP family cyanate transporter-like MFS transporter
VVTGWYAAADRTLEDETSSVPGGRRDDHVSRGVRDLVAGRMRRSAEKARRARSGDAGKAARPRLARPAGRHGAGRGDERRRSATR